MADIFISYAQGDREWVKGLASALEAKRFSVAWDPDLLPGSRSMKTELADAQAVIVVWSHLSIQSAWIKDEASKARAARRVVAVLREAVPPPAEFDGLTNFDLSDWQAGDGRAEFQNLVRTVSGLMPVAAALATAPARPAAPAPVARSQPAAEQQARWSAPLHVLFAFGALAGVVYFILDIMSFTRTPSFSALPTAAFELAWTGTMATLAVWPRVTLSNGIRLILALGAARSIATLAYDLMELLHIGSTPEPYLTWSGSASHLVLHLWLAASFAACAASGPALSRYLRWPVLIGLAAQEVMTIIGWIPLFRFFASRGGLPFFDVGLLVAMHILTAVLAVAAWLAPDYTRRH